MAVRKVCMHMGCRASPRCHHPWYFDVMHNPKAVADARRRIRHRPRRHGADHVERDGGEGMGAEVPVGNRRRT
jgi:hypothetical protein